jgi:hypothetical protein
MERDILGELDNYYQNLENQCQMQMFKQKMSLEQIQDLANCIKILGNALSFAENYSMMQGNKAKSEFTNYDYYYASKNTEKSLYFKKFVAAINNFDGVYNYYISKYNEEPLPKSLEKSDIIMRLQNYSKYAQSEKEKEIYQDFINVLDRKSINNVTKFVKSFKGDGTMNPEKIKDTFLDAKGNIDEQNDVEMKDAMNNPDYTPDIILNSDKPSITKHKKKKKK